MAVAEEVSMDKLHARVGQTLQVLVDGAKGAGRQGGVGRCYADAPEIDGVVYVKPPYDPARQFKVGEFIDVSVTAADAHDLWASVD